jgi:hypothetical protein
MTAHVILNIDRCHAVHNVSFQMTPNVGGVSGYSCTTAGCTLDLNPGCSKLRDSMQELLSGFQH